MIVNSRWIEPCLRGPLRGNKRKRSTYFPAFVLLTFFAFKRSYLGYNRRNSVIRVVFQSRGEYGRWALDKLIRKSFPTYEIMYSESKLVEHEYDLVLEGPPLFQKEAPCRYYEKPWIQFSSEPRFHYRDTEWCEHRYPPILRLDTSLLPQAQSLSNSFQGAMTPQTMWTPYACQYAIDFRSALHDRNTLDFNQRPLTIAWLSSNCVERRVSMWRAFVRVAARLQLHGVHSLGTCENNHVLNAGRAALYENTNIYKSYKMVLVMENSIEYGYVTEKLVQALAAGAIPIYYGHQQSVRAIFNDTSFVDVENIWRSVTTDGVEPSTDEEWDKVASVILNIVMDASLSRHFLLNNVFNQQRNRPMQNVLQPFPPECLGISGDELDTAYKTRSISRAIKTLRAQVRI